RVPEFGEQPRRRLRHERQRPALVHLHAEQPVVTPTNASGGPVDETAVLPRVRMDKDPEPGADAAPARKPSGASSGRSTRSPQSPRTAEAASDAEVTTELPQPPRTASASDETAKLPPVRDADAAETAVLPPVRGEGPADRVPPGYFRDERPGAGPDGSEDRTRELPQLDEQGAPRRRRRSDWAEETPLDDLPSLADELLGPHQDDDSGDGRGDGTGGGRGGGRGRGRRR
ncbi:hypothetical protein ABT136_28520, partial [Streptomyces sp. NPDC001856]